MVGFFNKKVFKKYLRLVYCYIFDTLELCFSKLDLERQNLDAKEQVFYEDHYRHALKRDFYNLFFKRKEPFWVDIFIVRLVSFNFKAIYDDFNVFRTNFRLLATRSGFYFNFSIFKNKPIFANFNKDFFLSGFNFLWKGFKLWIVSILLVSIIYCILVIKTLPFNKIFFSWIGVIMFTYWLISGFVFFFKKYKFGKYTTAIQRFWRRSYILFWLIEGSTFFCFFFFTLNASQESFFMFDQISFFKTHLFSWRLFFLKIFPIVLLILLTYFLILSLKWNIFNKQSLLLLVLTLVLTYVVWLEFYQFVHVLNFYGNVNWVFDAEEHFWFLEQEPRRTRMVNHYVMLLFVLKFWHIVFIYGFWIFFVLRSLEIKRIRYGILAANFQNFLILYIFAWVFMYPWFKFFFKNFLYSPYYWFYVNNRRLFLRVLFYDFKLVYLSLSDFFYFFKLKFLNFFNANFFYWNIGYIGNNYEQFFKDSLKAKIVNNII